MQANWEKVLQETIFPDLHQGRQDWDLPHTKAVVYWMKKICSSHPELEKKVLVAAAYAHDWGYVHAFSSSPSYQQIAKMKERHMEIGAELIRKLLIERLSAVFSQKQIKRVAHLVSVHDKLSQVVDQDEIALVEADTLGALDVERVKPTFSLIDNNKYLEEVAKKRRPLFRHQTAITSYDSLLRSRLRYYQHLD